MDLTLRGAHCDPSASMIADDWVCWRPPPVRSVYRARAAVSCWPPAPASDPSTRVTCATSIGASCGWSLLTDRAAHSDEHSRSQPHEQVMRQPDDDADFAPTLASASVTSNGRFGNYLHSLFFPLSPLRYLI